MNGLNETIVFSTEDVKQAKLRASEAVDVREEELFLGVLGEMAFAKMIGFDINALRNARFGGGMTDFTFTDPETKEKIAICLNTINNSSFRLMVNPEYLTEEPDLNVHFILMLVGSHEGAYKARILGYLDRETFIERHHKANTRNGIRPACQQHEIKHISEAEYYKLAQKRI